MKIEEAVEYMSTQFLERVLRSFNQDFPRRGEEEYRSHIVENIDTLSSLNNIKGRLENHFSSNKDPYSNQILYNFILKSLLSKPNFYATTEQIFEDVVNEENKIIELSKQGESFKHIDEKSIEILEAIIEVALEDHIISNDELALITKLRKKLSINEKDQYLIQAKLGLFPSKGNKVHTRGEVNSVIDELQKCGLVFLCNRHDEIQENILTIPDEMVDGVKGVLGIELTDEKYFLLLEKLQVKQLRDILSENNLNQSGVKEELIKRIAFAGIKPSDSLSLLSSQDLSDICSSIQNLKVSGRKEEKVTRLINYYSNLIVKKIDQSDKRQKYFEYFEQLASHDLDNLLGNNIISNHREVESAFEKGTEYLFENLLNHALLEFEGNEHADGGVNFDKNKNVLLWDNKSRVDGNAYKFPDAHYRQFRRYIRNERSNDRRVSCFLIITAEIDPIARENAAKLKADSDVDTDVALITAENLKLVAQNWKKYSKSEKFNLQVFNITGILTWDALRDRMNWHK